MAATDVAICNSALDLLGARYIASLAEATKEGRACNRNYNICRKLVLRDYPWNFATKRVVLDTPDATPPVFEFDNRFPLPVDFIRVHTVYDTSGSEMDPDSYRIEAGFILTYEGTLWLRYVYDLTTTTQFDAIFDEALAACLAWKISFLIEASDARNSALERAYYNILKKAKFTDSVEEPSRQFDDDEWLRSRNSNFNQFVRDPKTW